MDKIYDEILERIKSAEHIVLIAHKKPDADSVGSASAMYTFLMRLHKKATLFCETEHINPHIHFIPWFDKIRHSYPKKADLAISFDCGSYERLGIEVECDLINFDHHISNEKYGKYNCVNASAESTTRVLFDFFNYVYKESGERINQKMATALYSGLIDDTHNFLQQTSAQTFEMAQKLLVLKADKELSVQNLFQTESLASLRLKGLMLSGMQLFCNAQLVVHLVTRDMIESSGALEVDSEAALNESLFLNSVNTAVLLRENRDGSIKGSLRTTTELNMNRIAKQFGGGGHKSRAGFEIKEKSMQEIFEALKIIFIKELG